MESDDIETPYFDVINRPLAEKGYTTLSEDKRRTNKVS